MATYNVDITSKAIKSFDDLPNRLVTMHRKFDSIIHPRDIKVITNFLHNSTGNHFRTGENNSEMNHRFMRVIVDIDAGSKSATEKEQLMRRVVDLCIEYEKRHAEKTEIEVRINEIQKANVMRVQPTRS